MTIVPSTNSLYSWYGRNIFVFEPFCCLSFLSVFNEERNVLDGFHPVRDQLRTEMLVNDHSKDSSDNRFIFNAATFFMSATTLQNRTGNSKYPFRCVSSFFLLPHFTSAFATSWPSPSYSISKLYLVQILFSMNINETFRFFHVFSLFGLGPCPCPTSAAFYKHSIILLSLRLCFHYLYICFILWTFLFCCFMNVWSWDMGDSLTFD